jgi:hypothetical protein
MSQPPTSIHTGLRIEFSHDGLPGNKYNVPEPELGYTINFERREEYLEAGVHGDGIWWDIRTYEVPLDHTIEVVETRRSTTGGKLKVDHCKVYTLKDGQSFTLKHKETGLEWIAGIKGEEVETSTIVASNGGDPDAKVDEADDDTHTESGHWLGRHQTLPLNDEV